jgi:hypothetical protein
MASAGFGLRHSRGVASWRRLELAPQGQEAPARDTYSVDFLDLRYFCVHNPKATGVG